MSVLGNLFEFCVNKLHKLDCTHTDNPCNVASHGTEIVRYETILLKLCCRTTHK